MPVLQTGNLGIAVGVDFHNLPYRRKPDAVIDNMNNPAVLGEMFADMDNNGTYNFDYLNTQGWNNMAWCFYRLNPGCVVPKHVDHFINYMKYYKIQDRSKIVRMLVFLQDWKSGHYFEANDQSFTHWRAMDYVMWSNDTPHLGGNLGDEPRYTVQITGTID
jgi:hypothetical protein